MIPLISGMLSEKLCFCLQIVCQASERITHLNPRLPENYGMDQITIFFHMYIYLNENPMT